jgi:hypothetical protein
VREIGLIRLRVFGGGFAGGEYVAEWTIRAGSIANEPIKFLGYFDDLLVAIAEAERAYLDGEVVDGR